MIKLHHIDTMTTYMY